MEWPEEGEKDPVDEPEEGEEDPMEGPPRCRNRSRDSRSDRSSTGLTTPSSPCAGRACAAISASS